MEIAITAADLPGDRLRGLVERDWPIFVQEGETTRYVGDVRAAIAATDPHTARLATSAVRVDYAVLAPVTSPAQALAPGAPQLHAGGNVLSSPQVVRRRCRRGPGALRALRMWSQRSSRHSSSSTRSWSRNPPWRCPPRTGRCRCSRKTRASSTFAGNWRGSWRFPRSGCA